MLLLPGSFNPLHSGHLRMARCAEKMTGYECQFVVSKKNVDKPDLTDEEMLARKQQFINIGRECIIYKEYTYVGIANSTRTVLHLHPCETLYFAVGVDTILRINNPKYTYDRDELELVFDRLSCMNVRFIVCDRLGKNLSDLEGELSPNLYRLCIQCEDYTDGGESSSDIRQNGTLSGL